MNTPKATIRSAADYEALYELYGNERLAASLAAVAFNLSPILSIARTVDGIPAAAGGALWTGRAWEVWLITGKRWHEVAIDVCRYARNVFLPMLSEQTIISRIDIGKTKVSYLEWLGFVPVSDTIYQWRGN